MSDGVAKSARSTYHHGDLKRALIEAALTLVAEKGPRGFTLTEAARRAGVSPAAPYRHFPDKAHLLAAVAEQGFVELHEALVAAGSANGVTEQRTRVVAMARGYVRWAVAHPEYYQVMFGGDTNKSEHPGLLEAGGRTFGCLLEVITECLSSGLIQGDDPLRIAGPMWSTIHGIATLAIGGDLGQVGIDEQPEDLVQRSANVLLAGLALGVD